MPEPECPVWFDSAMEVSGFDSFCRSACLDLHTIYFPAETVRTGHGVQVGLQLDCSFLLAGAVCSLQEQHPIVFSAGNWPSCIVRIILQV